MMQIGNRQRAPIIPICIKMSLWELLLQAPPEDSAKLVEAYITSWIRKQLLIQEASRKIDINEAQVERKILDYRYSIIAYEYQNYYVKQHLDTGVSNAEIEKYYKDNKLTTLF